MIRINSKEVAAVRYGRRVVAAIYRGGRLLWQLANSCFGSGRWVNNSAWRNTDAWRNE